MISEHNSNYSGVSFGIEIKDNGYLLHKSGPCPTSSIHKTFTELVNQLGREAGLLNKGKVISLSVGEEY